MRLPQLLALLTLLGAIIHTPAWASEQFPSLEAIPSELLNKKPDELILASNMPKTILQGGLPICAGAAAWSVYLQKQCRTENSDCQNLDPAKIPSVLAVSGMGISDVDYRKIRSQKVVLFDSSGNGYNSLSALQGMIKIRTESCFPLDQFHQKYSGMNNQEINDLFKILKSKYLENRTKTEADICYDCIINDLKTNFSVPSDVETIRNALKKNYYEEFLYDVLLGSCKSKIEVFNKFKLGKWSESNSEISYKSFISTLKDRLKENIPVTSGFCMYEVKVPKCEGHEFVISGYRKVCDRNGKNCKEYIKTQNSWGEDYNKYYRDGWINAENYYKYSEKKLVWIE